jgi:hypothetical protein
MNPTTLKVIQIMAKDSNLAVLSDFGLQFEHDGKLDYHEFACAMLSINAQQFRSIGEVVVTLASKKMSFNEMYKDVEIFRKFIDRNVKLIVEIDEDEQGTSSIESRMRKSVTQFYANKKWNVPEGSMKFIRLKKSECNNPDWIRDRLWGLKI